MTLRKFLAVGGGQSHPEGTSAHLDVHEEIRKIIRVILKNAEKFKFHSDVLK